jgi:spore maturation protein SpmB
MRRLVNVTALWVSGGTVGWNIARWDDKPSMVVGLLAIACFVVVWFTTPES